MSEKKVDDHEKALRETFLSFYKQLSAPYKEIVFTTLHLMERKKEEALKDATFKMIEESRKALNISYTELLKKLAEKYNCEVEDLQKTYEAFLHRKSLNSSLTPGALEVLEIKSSDPRYIIEQSKLVSNISWLFDTLSATNKQAVTILTINLYRLEFNPESFEDDFYE